MVEITRTLGQKCRGQRDIIQKLIRRLGRYRQCTPVSRSSIYSRDYLNQIDKLPS